MTTTSHGRAWPRHAPADSWSGWCWYSCREEGALRRAPTRRRGRRPSGELRIRVLDFGEIGGARPRVELVQHVEAPLVCVELADVRIRVVEAAKDNGFSRAGLLAGGLQLRIADGPILQTGDDSRPLDALDAVSTFLHHSARPDGDVRVVNHPLHLAPLRRPVQVVEVADFVGAVVGAVPGP